MIPNSNSSTLCGLDEVGRGPLAGPLVACGVILRVPPDKLLSQLPVEPKDSKLLSPKNRQAIHKVLTEKSPHQLISYRLKLITVPDINTHGIAWANRQAFLEIIAHLPADHYIIDGNLKLNNLTMKQFNNFQIDSVIDADESVLEVMLASIIAKVHRDRLMQELHHQHPHYHWHTNAGYATRHHLESLAKYGPTPHHRTLFTTTALQNYHSKHPR